MPSPPPPIFDLSEIRVSSGSAHDDEKPNGFEWRELSDTPYLLREPAALVLPLRCDATVDQSDPRLAAAASSSDDDAEAAAKKDIARLGPFGASKQRVDGQGVVGEKSRFAAFLMADDGDASMDDASIGKVMACFRASRRAFVGLLREHRDAGSLPLLLKSLLFEYPTARSDGLAIGLMTVRAVLGNAHEYVSGTDLDGEDVFDGDEYNVDGRCKDDYEVQAGTGPLDMRRSDPEVLLPIMAYALRFGHRKLAAVAARQYASRSSYFNLLVADDVELTLRVAQRVPNVFLAMAEYGRQRGSWSPLLCVAACATLGKERSHISVLRGIVLRSVASAAAADDRGGGDYEMALACLAGEYARHGPFAKLMKLADEILALLGYLPNDVLLAVAEGMCVLGKPVEALDLLGEHFDLDAPRNPLECTHAIGELVYRLASRGRVRHARSTLSAFGAEFNAPVLTKLATGLVERIRWRRRHLNKATYVTDAERNAAIGVLKIDVGVLVGCVTASPTEHGLRLGEWTFASAIHACTYVRRFSDAEAIFRHAVALNDGRPTVDLVNALAIARVAAARTDAEIERAEHKLVDMLAEANMDPEPFFVNILLTAPRVTLAYAEQCFARYESRVAADPLVLRTMIALYAKWRRFDSAEQMLDTLEEIDESPRRKRIDFGICALLKAYCRDRSCDRRPHIQRLVDLMHQHELHIESAELRALIDRTLQREI
jgi:hypothetical protein